MHWQATGLKTKQKRNKKELRCEYNSKAITDFTLLGAFNSQIACGSALQESLEWNRHKVQWAVRCWETLAIPLAVSNAWPASQTRSSVHSFRRYKNSTRSVTPFSLVHVLPSYVARAQCNIATLKPSWSRPSSPHIFFKDRSVPRDTSASSIRLAVLFARLQIRVSTLGPLHSALKAFAVQPLHPP